MVLNPMITRFEVGLRSCQYSPVMTLASGSPLR